MHFSDRSRRRRRAAVFTIHNLAFQGVFPAADARAARPRLGSLQPEALEYWGQISYLKAGINFSEKITTVSPTYAREILTPDMGFGFEGVLAAPRATISIGILNGIDTARWNPEADAFVPAHFAAHDLSGKRQAKRALLQTAGLPAGTDALERPVIGMISRLTDQKGLRPHCCGGWRTDVARRHLDDAGQRRTAVRRALWRALAARHPDRVSATIGFDERLAHLIEAGADMFLMPSRFEPCGLNQMYSLRYGTVPIVRATGGLRTRSSSGSEPDGNGFKFSEYTPAALRGGGPAGARRSTATGTAGRRLQRAGMARGPLLGRFRPGICQSV